MSSVVHNHCSMYTLTYICVKLVWYAQTHNLYRQLSILTKTSTPNSFGPLLSIANEKLTTSWYLGMVKIMTRWLTLKLCLLLRKVTQKLISLQHSTVHQPIYMEHIIIWTVNSSSSWGNDVWVMKHCHVDLNYIEKPMCFVMLFVIVVRR